MKEHRVLIEDDGNKFKNVPDDLLGIELGDRLLVTKYPKTHKYTKNQMFCKGLRIEADEYLRDAMANGESIMFCIEGETFPETHRKMFIDNGYTGDFKETMEIEIYCDMLTFFDKEPAKPQKETVEKKNYSIVQKTVDESIIHEMISLIDKDRIRKTMNVAIGSGGKTVDSVVDQFIDDWAHAKYDFYIAFGHKLSVSSPIEFNIDENEMSPMVYEMYAKYPMYAATIDKIVENGSMKAFVDNKAPDCDFFRKYMGGIYKPGMKISKFFSQCFKNDTFDIDFSKVMQDRRVRGNVVVSIDPYDFITAATNMHGWTSCVAIFKPSHAAGSFTWVTDPNALIAYRDNGKTYTYDHIVARDVGGGRTNFEFGKNSFEGNSKSWRQIINVDKENCAFLFGREYPQNKDIAVVSDKAREVVEETIGKYLGISDWDNYGDLRDIASKNYFSSHPLYKDVTNHHYSDIANWEGLKSGGYPTLKKALISPHNTDMSKVTIKAGGKMRCFICGELLDSDRTSCTCRNH